MIKLVEKNIVILGNLNPAIIQPKWLVKIGLIPPGEKIGVNFSVGANLPMEFVWENHLSWIIDSSTLKVTIPPDNPTIELKKFVSTIFNRLEHTPISATGQNFIFEGEPIERLNSKFSCQDNFGLSKNTQWGTISSLKHEMTIQKDEVSNINIYLTKSLNKSHFHVNFHNEASTANQVVNFSKEIENHLKISEEILESLTEL